ncbi:MAG: SBBP repeat-containing protein [Bacteroidetes bacterium]|nr:SBBP repeat-containing protein [Bacteroidota bacterium]
MRRKTLLILPLILLNAYAFGQNFAWAKGMGGSSNEIGYSIAVDKIGNVYTTGYFNSTMDFDPGNGIYNLTPTGSFDIFISKLDATGNFIWAKIMGGVDMDVAYSICIDDSGNVLTTGEFWGTADFDPGVGVFSLTAPGAIGGNFISKLDSSGKFIWAKSFIGYYSSGLSISVDVLGNVFTTGEFAMTVDFDPGNGTFNMTSTGTDIFISKLNSFGDFIWAKRMGGNSVNYGNSIVIDENGNVYTTGLFNGSTDFDPNSGTYNLTGNDDLFISKLDSSGNFVWAKRMGGNGVDQGLSIAIDTFENVYTTGGFGMACDFNPGIGTYTLTSAGSDDIFISKLDSSGNFIWAKRIGANGSDFGSSIKLDKAGDVYISGSFQGTVDFDPNGGTSDLISSGGDDIFVLKLDSSGTFVWAKKLGGPGQDIGLSIVLDKSRNVYATGVFQLTDDFDPDTGIYNLTSQGAYDIYVLKLCAPSFPAGIISGPTSVCLGSTKTYTIAVVEGATGYLWNIPTGSMIISGQNTTAISVTFGVNSGNITVTPLSSCGNGTSASLGVTINPLPKVKATAIPSTTICKNSYVTLKGTGALTYTWTGGIPDGVSFLLNSDSTFIVSGTDMNGCINTDTITIKIIPFPEKIKQRNYYVCIGKTVTLSAENNGMKYLWNTNDTTQKIIVAQGKYVVKISNQQCFIYDTVEVLNFTTLKPVIIIQNNQLTSTKGNTYKWFNADTLILNESKQQFAPKHNGYYKVLITDSNGCEAISDSIYFERIFKEFKIYPNPSKNKFTIEVPQSIELKSISIYDAIGRELLLNYTYQEGLVELNLEDYASGGYIILIKDAAGKEWVRKVVKK